MDVHNHGSEDGPGLGCPEMRQPDGTLLGYCQTPIGRSHEKISARIDRLADRIAHAGRREDRFRTEVQAVQDEVARLKGGGPVTERLSDLSDDALAWIAERLGVASDERITEIATELLALRAQQAPTTDEPAAWLVEYVDEDSEEMVYLDRRLAEVYADQEGGEAVPLYRHPAPATDEALDKGGALPAGATRTNDTGVPINVAQGRRDGGDQ